MSLVWLLLVVAVVLLAVAGLTATGTWIFWAALICAAASGLLSLTGNDRNL